MKKQFLAAGFAVISTLAASAQTKEEMPLPPPPPPPPAVKMKEVAPPPAPPLAPDAPAPPPDALEPQHELEAFLKRNPSVTDVYWKMDALIVVELKGGKKEIYKLNDSKSLGEAEAKYGKLPTAPPPPPPLPPPPPSKAKRSVRS